MSPDVLIYIQKVRDYLNNDEGARQYFLDNTNEDLFFEHLTEISQKNFDKNGDPTLSRLQFEILRKTVSAINKIKLTEDETVNDNIYLTINGFGKICLN